MSDGRILPGQVSVVICAYTEQRWGDLGDAVASVRDQVPSAAELIVAIDHNPVLLARCRDAFPDAIVVANAGRQGLSATRNAGIAAATGEVVAFLDDDAAARAGWLATLAAGYEHPGVLGVGGRIEPLWSTARPPWWPPEFDWVVGCTYAGMPTAAGSVRNLIGASMSLRRSVFAEIGGFSDGLGRVGRQPLGCEETELCIRLHQRWPVAELRHAPAAVVDHRVGPDRATWRYFRSRCFAEGVSKSAVGALVGSRDALASERAYVLRTLPRAAVGHLAGRRPRRALSLAAGLACTAAGFAVGTASRLTARRSVVASRRHPSARRVAP